MRLYLDNGYFNMREIIYCGMPFVMIVGARGTGKTYGTLETLIEDETRFILMRRTQKTLDKINKPAFSPFNDLNAAHGWSIYPFAGGEGSAIYMDGEYDEHNKLHPGEKTYGISLALSTVATMRGVGLSEYEVLFYDEFIKEAHEKPIPNEGAAFANAYETINRNRELQGRPPLICVCAANSNDLGNPLFVYLGLVEEAIKLQKSDRDYVLLPDRGCALFMPHKSPISDRKKDTALYKLTHSTSFGDMALRNTFLIEGEDTINSVNLREYRPLVTAGVLTIYEHKSQDVYFASFHRSGNPDTYREERIELLRFKNRYMWLWGEHMEKRVVFETYSAMKIFESYFATM